MIFLVPHRRMHMNSPTFSEIRKLEQSGELNEYQRSLYFESRPEEELFDVFNDSHEMCNLADDSKYERVLHMMTRIEGVHGDL